MTITPYEGIVVFDVEENAYVFKEKGMYFEGMASNGSSTKSASNASWRRRSIR